MISEYLKKTLNYIIDHASYETKRHFNVSLTYGIVATLCIVPVILLYTIMVAFAYGRVSAQDSLLTFFTDIGQDVLLTYHMKALAEALGILCIGVYASFVISCMNDIKLQDKEKYKWSDFRQYISGDEWMWFLRFAAVLFVVHFITVKELKDLFVSYDALGEDNMAKFGLPGQTTFLSRLIKWFDSIILLIKYYLPYLLTVLFVVTVYENKLNRDIIRRYKSGIVAAIVLAFCVAQLKSILISYFNTYVGGLIDVFFYTRVTLLLPGSVRFCAAICVMALFMWAGAAAFALPIKMQSEEAYEVEEEPLPDEVLPKESEEELLPE